MLIFRTSDFKKDYRKLPINIQRAVDKQLGLLLENPNHPSLNLKKMQDPRDIWEGRITYSYRFTLQIIKEKQCILRRVGTHDILKKP